MTTEQELNEKLAKWAGFKRMELGRRGFHWERMVRIPNWLAPGGTEYWDSRPYLPNLTDSLDACFKWLVPKLSRVSIYTGKTVGPDDASRLMDSGYYAIALSKEQNIIEEYQTIAFDDNNPTMALCRAIEQLIDKEVADE